MSVSALVLNPEVKAALDAGFESIFAAKPERYFSAPGRTEVSGNHTDHQRGRVLAGAVNLDTVAAVKVNGTDKIRIQSKGYPMCEIDLSQLEPVASEINSTPALIRGVAAGSPSWAVWWKDLMPTVSPRFCPVPDSVPPLPTRFSSVPSSTICSLTPE